MRMHFVVLFVLAMYLLFLGRAATADTTEKSTRPNVLFIAIDDLRPELGCYGDTQVKSPNIDRLASQGMVFRRAYCQVPVCGASRASLMTSILPTPRRFVDFSTWAEKDAPEAVTLPQVFKEAGYTTLSNGKIFHHAADTNARSWSEPAWNSGTGHAASFDPASKQQTSAQGRSRIYEYPDVSDNTYKDGQTAEKTIQDLQRLKESGKSFFLACGFIRPHMPFYAPKKYWDLYDRDKIVIADNRFRPENAPDALRGSAEYKSYDPGTYQDGTEDWHRLMRHGYYASTSYSDKLTGDVLNELERLGLTDNTIVVLWGDHGWHLGEHGFWGKHNTLHNALRIPLIVKVPGKPAGKTEALVETLDIFPTLCALAGLAAPESAQGRSFFSLFDNPQQPFRDVIYSRFKTADAVVTEQFGYTRYENGETMLYDHRRDPQENRNVVGNPEYGDTVAQMEGLLDAFIKQAQDVTLSEKVQ